MSTREDTGYLSPKNNAKRLGVWLRLGYFSPLLAFTNRGEKEVINVVDLKPGTEPQGWANADGTRFTVTSSTWSTKWDGLQQPIIASSPFMLPFLWRTAKQIKSIACQSIIVTAHQCDDRPVLEDLLPRHQAEPEHVRQHKFPGGPVECPNDRDSDADEAVEVVRQRRRVSDAAGWADEWCDEHYG